MTAQQAQDLARIIDELQAAAESKGDETPPNSSDRFRLLREIGQINRPRTPTRDAPSSPNAAPPRRTAVGCRVMSAAMSNAARFFRPLST